MDDTQLLLHLAALMGWEVVGPGIDESLDGQIYVDLKGRYYRKADAGWVEWRPLSSMDDAMGIVERLGERGWIYELGTGEDGHRMAFARLGQREPCYGTAATPARAICLAALETREEGNT